MYFLHAGGLAAALILASAGAYAAPTPASPPAATAVLTAPALVAAVLNASPSLAASRAAARAAHADAGSAGALEDPVLTWGLAPNTVGARNIGTRQQVQLSQAFPWPGTLSLRTKTARDEADAADFGYADRRLRLAEQARAAYATWFYVHRALAINTENRTLVMHLRKVAETEYAAGQAPEQDVLAAEVELTRLDNQRLELASRLRGVQAQINALLDRDPRTPLAAPAALPESTTLPPQTQLESLSLTTHPALQSLGASARAAGERVGLAEKAGYPSFRIFAGYNGAMDPAPKRLVVGVGLSIPLYRGKYRSEVHAAEARRDASEAALEQARAEWLGELETARAAVEQAQHSVALYTGRLLPLARQNLAAAESDYRNGSGDFTKLITAERQYLLAQLELARNRADYFTQLAALDYRAGGFVFGQTPGKELLP